jgi:hypothetical protein
LAYRRTYDQGEQKKRCGFNAKGIQFPEPGLDSQVASCARADVAASNATAAVVVSKCARIAPPPVQKRLNIRLPQDASANWAKHQPLVEI